MIRRQDAEREAEVTGAVFNIEKFHIHDGEGIRTNVFLKGCNLTYPWCCNPESQLLELQVAVHRNLCTACGQCVGACPSGAIRRDNDGAVSLDKEACVRCGACVGSCPRGAREVYGSRMSVAEVIRKVEKDSAYYIGSGGGMTVSGGEPCLQPLFTRELALAAKRRYIHTAMETAGAVPWEQMWQAAEHIDEILIDVKFTSAEEFAGISPLPLDVVKGNIRGLRQRNKLVRLRCPIIPGVNLTNDHVAAVSRWAEELDVRYVDLLPFHQLGRHKYDSLGYEYTLGSVAGMKHSDADVYRDYLVARGLEVSIGG